MEYEKKRHIASVNHSLARFSQICAKNWPLSLFVIVSPLVAPAAPQLTTLVNLDSNNANPQCTLIQDSVGDLFGTSDGGGINQLGSIFEVSTGTHIATTLASFTGTNGYQPTASLLDISGNLYGASGDGGSIFVNGVSLGFGAVFELPAGPSNPISTLYSFSGPDGFGPGDLVADAQGNLYGTTVFGGSDFINQFQDMNGHGTLFEISSATHAFKSILSFTNGVSPTGLTKGPNGLFYGMTRSEGPTGFGTIFDFDPTTGNFSTLAAFSLANGTSPNPGLAFDNKGDIFGTMGQGGNDFGTIFELPAGSSTVETLFSFSGTGGPVFPRSAPIVDSAGDIFGTTINGGDADNDGTVYELPAGANTLTTMSEFDIADGEEPVGGLIADSAGNLYGTTIQGGSMGYGTVYEIMGSGFVVPEPASLFLTIVAATLLGQRRRSERDITN